LDNDTVGGLLQAARTCNGALSSSPGALDAAIRESGALAPQIGLTDDVETANVIPVACQLQDYAGNAIAAEATFKAYILDANGIMALAAAFHIGKNGVPGTEVTNTDQAQMLLKTAADGTIDLDVTDVVGASGATVYLVCEMVDAPGVTTYVALTFD